MRTGRNETTVPQIARTLAGPILFALILALPRPEGLAAPGHATLAVAGWMAAWWLTVAVPLAVTALLPLVLLPLLGIAGPTAAASPYANPVIFLFMGGFFLAASMERWNLHRRLALAVVHGTGTSPRRLVAGFMTATAFLSMWMSNTAATLMMMPIGVAVLRLVQRSESGSETPNRERVEARGELGPALMLGIAYAGSIGGVATLIGTPPNAVLAGVADELLGLELSFARWLTLGLPIAAVMLPMCWALLCFVLHDLASHSNTGMAELLHEQRAQLGTMHPGERITAWTFALAAVAWILRAPKTIGTITIPGIQSIAPEVGDATIAIAAALILFLWPVRDRDGRSTQTLDWEHAQRIPWDILILFGGGLSLAAAFESTGLTGWLGGKLVVASGFPSILIVAVVTALFVVLTEITSNTATATLGLPVVASVAPSMGMAPLPLMGAAALGSSMAFMLPVATPPNAIVFGSGYIEARQMRRAGIWLNITSILVITLGVWLASAHLGFGS